MIPGRFRGMTTIESLAYLRASGLDPKHAEAILEVVERSQGDFVTKADLDAAMARVDAKFSALEAKMDTGFSEVEQKFSALRADMDTKFSALQADMTSGHNRLEAKISESKLAFWWPVALIVVAQIAQTMMSHFWK
jgi:hypothetical protein